VKCVCARMERVKDGVGGLPDIASLIHSPDLSLRLSRAHACAHKYTPFPWARALLQKRPKNLGSLPIVANP